MIGDGLTQLSIRLHVQSKLKLNASFI